MIVGVDTGNTTGISWWDDLHQRLEATAQQPAAEAVFTLWAWLEEHASEPVEVALEWFDLTQQTVRATRQYDALHVAGAVRFKCLQLGVPYYTYSRSNAKRFATDVKLQRLGLYRRGQGHANDATRQVLTHLASTRPRVLEQLLLDAAGRHG